MSAAVVATVAAYVACALGALLGARAVVDPAWASRIVRLVPDPGQREGRTELRAIYGGLFFTGHVFAAAALAFGPPGAVWAAAAVGAGWLGAGVARAGFVGADRAVTGYALFGIGFEFVLGAALVAPLVVAHA